jgi:hypothetical protein
MVKSPSCFNLYWGWLLIFLGSHESQVADPMIEADIYLLKQYKR